MSVRPENVADEFVKQYGEQSALTEAATRMKDAKPPHEKKFWLDVRIAISMNLLLHAKDGDQ